MVIRVSKPEYDNNGELKPNRYAYTKDWNRRPEENKDFTIFEYHSNYNDFRYEQIFTQDLGICN